MAVPNYADVLKQSMSLLTGGSQVGEISKKLVPLLKHLEHTVEEDLVDFPWNWHQNFKADAETFKRIKADLDNLLQDLKTKQFTNTGLSIAYPAVGAVLLGIQGVIQMIKEILALIKVVGQLLKIIDLFKKGFDRILAFLKEMIDVQKMVDKVYAELQVALYEAMRAALRKAEQMRQLLLFELKLRVANVKLEQYKALKINLENRLTTAPTNQIGIIKNLIKSTVKNIKDMEAEIVYCERAITALNQ